MWEFEEWQCLTAFIFGIISGCLCLTTLIIVGITKQIFARLKLRFDRIAPRFGTILCPLVGGAIVGKY